MSFIEGNQKRVVQEDFLKKFNAVEGYIDQQQAAELVVEYLMTNPYLAARTLLGIEIYPFQHLLSKTIMNSDYTMGVLSRGCGKSFISAVVILLMMIFTPGIQVGILAPSFRQSKLLLRKMEDILSKPKAEIISSCLEKNSISKRTDEWTLQIGRSVAKALPMGDGEKLRGERFQLIVIDEFLKIPERVFNEVITPFLSTRVDPIRVEKIRRVEDRRIALGKMREEDRMTFDSNKLVLFSSASYRFEYMYKLYCQYERLIMGDRSNPEDKEASGTRAIFHMSYDAVPKSLYDENLIKQAKETMSETQFNREFGSQFPDDSSGYYRLSALQNCQLDKSSGVFTEIVGEPGAEYILSFDPSWAESDSSDDWALSVFKLHSTEKKWFKVHGYAMAGQPTETHIRYFKYVLDNFNIVGIVGDYNGGVAFLGACNASAIFKEANLKIETFEFNNDGDPSTYMDALIEARREYNRAGNKICVLRKPSSTWIRYANEKLQTSINRRQVLFAAQPEDSIFRAMAASKIKGFEGLIFKQKRGLGITRSMEDDLMDGKGDITIVDLIENQTEIIQQTISQCVMIEPTTTATGSQTFDLPPNMRKSTSANKQRKDSYSALVLGNWFCEVYIDMMRDVKPIKTTFKPFFV